MTAVVPHIGVRAVLFGAADPVDAVTRSPGWRRVLVGLGTVLGAVSTGGRRAIEREASSCIAGLLHPNVGDLLVAGWQRHRALVAAAHATAANPLATEVVQLATHQITTGHRPYVEVVVNGVRVATLHFELSLTFDLDAVLGTVRQGKLVAIEGGRCTVTATLACEGQELAARQATIDPSVTVHLGTGVPLLRPAKQDGGTGA